MTLSTKPMAKIMTLKQNIQGWPKLELQGPGIIYSICCGYTTKKYITKNTIILSTQDDGEEDDVDEDQIKSIVGCFY